MSNNHLLRPVAVGALLIITAFALSVSLAQAQSAEDFFKKAERLTMYVGSGAGGGYDQHARLVARNLTRFLPGHPNFTIEYMPTAAGVQATDYLYNSAPKDGSVILADTNSSLALAIYNSPAAHYDPRRFEWIGSTGKQQAVCLTWKASRIETLDDAKKREVTVSASSITASPGIYPIILNSMLGTRFKVIPGYSSQGIFLAVERGEVDGLCGYPWQGFMAMGSKWFVDHDVNVVIQMGLTKNPDLLDVPLVDDLVRNPDDKNVLDMIELQQEFGWPYLAPPGTPPDRMAIYRQAFQAMVKDPQFLADAKSQRIDVDPLDDKAIEALLDRAYAMPETIRDRAAAFVMPP